MFPQTAMQDIRISGSAECAVDIKDNRLFTDMGRKVGGIMNTSVALLQSSQVGLHKSLMVGMGYSVNVGNNVTFSVGKTMKENTGQTAVYSAGEHLELCCGKARLVLTKDGSIFLNGTHIHLEGESDVNGDAPVINWNCGATQPVPDAPVPKDLPPGMPDMRQF